MADYEKGQKVRLSAVFKNLAAVATDPTTVTVKIKNPAKTVTTATPTKDSTGNYHYDVTLNSSGNWYYRFEGTGTVTAANEAKITVNKSQF